nr:uncharacterized protein LOC106781908 isoform X3 [Equus caballus]XP_023478102.1 uncharacterized protein LOC111768790 isoform X3 [Equus caballus]
MYLPPAAPVPGGHSLMTRLGAIKTSIYPIQQSSSSELGRDGIMPGNNGSSRRGIFRYRAAQQHRQDWALDRNTASEASPKTYRIRICLLTRCPGAIRTQTEDGFMVFHEGLAGIPQVAKDRRVTELNGQDFQRNRLTTGRRHVYKGPIRADRRMEQRGAWSPSLLDTNIPAPLLTVHFPT